jgi:TonB-linked SusC/RagA family outer membrane protein
MTKFFRTNWLIGCAIALVAGLVPTIARAQAVVAGTILSEQGQPLAGSGVQVDQLNVSAAANPAGNFTITVPAGRVSGQTVVVRARAIGYKPQSRTITLTPGRQEIVFTLLRDATQLSEVVVTGVTKATEQIKVPFTVTKLDTAQMPVQGSNAITQLQGKVPGAMIVSATGRPGAAPSVVLRGPVSLNATGRSQGPLYMLDGVPLQGSLPDINPADIENVEVLKGAAAASLYGARAGSGVINITTKSGKNAQPGVRTGIRTEIGSGDIERRYPLARNTMVSLDPTGQYFCEGGGIQIGGSPCSRYINWDDEVQRMNNSGIANSNPSQPIKNDIGIGNAPTDGYNQLTGLYQVTRWPRMRDPIGTMVTPSAYANTSVDMRGKVSNTGFYGSIGNSVQQGSIRALGGYKRNSARLNVDQVFTEKFSANLNTFYSQTIEDGTQFDDGTGGLWFNLSRNPWMVDVTALDALGRYVIRPNVLQQGSQNTNPLYASANYKLINRGTRFVGGTNLKYSPIDWLSLDGTFGYDRATGIATEFQDLGFRTATSSPLTASGYIGTSNEDDAQYTVVLNATATRTFLTDLNATFTSRYAYGDQTLRGQNLNGRGLATAGLETANAASTNYAIGSSVQTIRDMGFFFGADLDFRDRYVLSGVIRRDGSSLFGAGNRWQTFGRLAGSWIVSREPWWPASNVLSLFKLRASQGSTGQRPRFSAQYETFSIGTGGTLTPATLGNRLLKPEINTETELAADVELFGRYALNVTHARAVIDGQILPVKAPTASGFTSQWQNVGEITNKTWEATLNVPILTRGSFNWTSRLIWDRTRSQITRLDVPEFIASVVYGGNTYNLFKFKQGEMIGTVYGNAMVVQCGQLPGTFAGQCSMDANDLSAAYRPNSDGFIAWFGAGNRESDGITKNLWRSQLPQGSTTCLASCSGPWGNNTNWGMPITLRDSTNSIAFAKLGNGLPKYHWGLSQNIDYKRVSLYGLLDASIGQHLWNIVEHWSLGDFQSSKVDQTGKSVEDAKPVGYYWRRGPSQNPGGNVGVGGIYDALGPSSWTFDDASYVKLREASVNFRVGEIGGRGDWSVGLVGRNLHTWTKWRGFDPEGGSSLGVLNSSALTPITGFRFPNLRTYTVQLSTAF